MVTAALPPRIFAFSPVGGSPIKANPTASTTKCVQSILHFPPLLTTFMRKYMDTPPPCQGNYRKNLHTQQMGLRTEGVHDAWGLLNEHLLATTVTQRAASPCRLGDGARSSEVGTGVAWRNVVCYRWGVMRRPFVWVLLCVCLITGIAGAVYYQRIARFWGITKTDFTVYYFAGWRILHSQSMYATDDPEYLFKYAPPVGVAFTPLARLRIQHALWSWYALTGIAFCIALASVRSLLRRSAGVRELPLLGYALLVLAILRPYLSNLRLGQIDVVLACLLLIAVMAAERGRPMLAGWCLAATMICKLVPAVWLVYCAATRRWRVIGWTVIAMGAYLLLPIPTLGVAGTAHALRDWWAITQTSGQNWEWLVRFKNQSVLSTVLRMLSGGSMEHLTPLMMATALTVTVGLGLLYAAAVWRAITRPDARPGLGRLVPASLTMIAMVIFSPHAWKATYIHLLLPYAVVVMHLLQQKSTDRWGWVLLGGSFALVSVTAPDVLLGRPLSHVIHTFSPMTWGAALLAAAVWRVQEVRAGR